MKVETHIFQVVGDTTIAADVYTIDSAEPRPTALEFIHKHLA